MYGSSAGSQIIIYFVSLSNKVLQSWWWINDTKLLLYLIQNPDIVEKALKEPQNFVLKPQREGGGKCLIHVPILYALS